MTRVRSEFSVMRTPFSEKKTDEKFHFCLNQETRFPLIMKTVAPHYGSENPSFYVEFYLCLFSQFKK